MRVCVRARACVCGRVCVCVCVCMCVCQVYSVELSPVLGEVDVFFVLQFIVSKVDEGEILEVETTVR